MNFDITGYHMLIGLGSMVLSIIAIIYFMRRYYHRNNFGGKSNQWSERAKYAAKDAFRHSAIYFRIGLICSLLITVLAFNYTSYEKVEAFNFVYEIDELVENSPPVVRPERPLPPPPPPSKVIDVIQEVDEIVETVEFVEPVIPEPEPVVASIQTKPVKKRIPPPPPPLPDPPIVDAPPMIKSEIMPRMCTSCENEDLTRSEKNTCASKEMLKFVLSKLKYPTLAREIGVQGVCPVKLVINKDGTISNIELLREIGAGCGKEALRVTSMLKEKCWLPGRQNGQRVAVQMVLPIRFKLD